MPALDIYTAIAASASLAGVMLLVLRIVLSVERRLATLETKVEPYRDAFRQIVVSHLQGISPGGNPVSAERWQYLLSRFQNNILSLDEARELQAAFLEQQEQARRKNDSITLIAILLGLVLLAVLLKEK